MTGDSEGFIAFVSKHYVLGNNYISARESYPIIKPNLLKPDSRFGNSEGFIAFVSKNYIQQNNYFSARISHQRALLLSEFFKMGMVCCNSHRFVK